MHDLHLERFLETSPATVRSRLHAARHQGQPAVPARRPCLTLEDTVEFFNLVLELKLTPEEKHNLVEFMRQL